MQYYIEPIGVHFSDKAIPDLANRFNARAKEGYKFHSVFQVSRPGCLGIGQAGVSYPAIYVKEE